jgi:hypothetical protein
MWITATLVLGGVAAALSAHLPGPAVLPALSIAMIVAGLSLAAVLYLAGYRPSTGARPAWEVAAVLVFLGCAGTMLSSNEQTLALLGTGDHAGLANLR